MDILLECSLRSALIAAAVALIVAVLRIREPRTRHVAWLGVLVAMLLLPAFTAWGPRVGLPLLPPVSSVVVAPDWAPPLLADTAPAPRSGPALVPAPLPVREESWKPSLLLTIYFGVVAVLLARLLLGTVRAASLLKRATVEQSFVSCSECVCAVTIGWFRPVVMLPPEWREWPEGELEAVLAHEREHVRRRDPLVQWLAALNRCVFWFHPLAWWLERKLATLAEEACDAAVIAHGHDPAAYSEYLIHQARAVRNAGSRVALQASAMGSGCLARRIERLLGEQPRKEMSKAKACFVAALCAASILVFGGCTLERAEQRAPGQPTMNELMHRGAEERRKHAAAEKAMLEEARRLRPEELQSRVELMKKNPKDSRALWALIRRFEMDRNFKEVSALRLWYIEHHPTLAPGNINPRVDRDGYERGKRLWLAHTKRPGALPEVYQRAADFLEGADRELAGSVLEAGRKAHPNDPRWTMSFGRHYSQALLGSAEPLTEFNVFRTVSAEEAASAYAKSVRARLAESTDVDVLAETSRWLAVWSKQFYKGGDVVDAIGLAGAYADRALSLDPHSKRANSAKLQQQEFVATGRVLEMRKMSPNELAALSDSDRMLHGLYRIRDQWRRDGAEVEADARNLLVLAARNGGDPRYGDAIFEAHIVLGKIALRRGDKRTASRELLAATATPGSPRIGRGELEMNLPRALVDWGERSTVAEFLQRMAPKTARFEQFLDWAASIRKGINPDLIPTFTPPGCTKDPC